ncbi:hypothetical protein Ccrd_020742 [Cynara cardunculus var. scolymus]|uniref:NTF2 domain-containing protein n=1 Tax=Cynara cardunculus var. scolymus TaxID=59895 RepID=A0A103Y1X6_CYNCS|nr:hypothetical protein Ccrd_020742 [Cynara cardunculus var. scolymus]
MDEVGQPNKNGKSSITKPAGGLTVEEVHSVRWEITLIGCSEMVVVPWIDTRIAKHKHATNVILSCDLSYLHDCDGNGWPELGYSKKDQQQHHHDALSKAFVEHCYTTFDTNRAALANLYQETSMLTFEGQKIQGSQNIVNNLTSFPFQQCKHSITTIDCQPSGPAGSMLVFVSGNLQLAGNNTLLSSVRYAQLAPTTTKNGVGLELVGRLDEEEEASMASVMRTEISELLKGEHSLIKGAKKPMM